MDCDRSQLNRTSSGSKEIHIYGFSPLFNRWQPNYRSFTEKLLSDIVQAALDQIPQNDLKLKSNPSFRDEIPYIVQYNESNFHFLNRIADKYGEWCFYNGSELIFGSLNKSKVIEVIVDRNLIDLIFHLIWKILIIRLLLTITWKINLWQGNKKLFSKRSGSAWWSFAFQIRKSFNRIILFSPMRTFREKVI